MAHLLIVEARSHAVADDLLLDGARQAIAAAGHSHETLVVPGALEVPGTIALCAEAGQYDAYVALGVVVRDATWRFDVVASESARGIMALTLDGMAIGNGILTVADDVQALACADRTRGDEGGRAAKAAIAMFDLKERIGIR